MQSPSFLASSTSTRESLSTLFFGLSLSARREQEEFVVDDWRWEKGVDEGGGKQEEIPK